MPLMSLKIGSLIKKQTFLRLHRSERKISLAFSCVENRKQTFRAQTALFAESDSFEQFPVSPCILEQLP